MTEQLAISVSSGHFKKLRELNRRKNYFMKKVRLDAKLLVAKIIWDKYKKNTLNVDSIKTILLIRNEGTIGDTVVYSPLIKNLHTAGYKVDILLTKSSSIVVKYNPFIRNIYEADDASTEVYLKSFNHTVSEITIEKLKNNQYDLVIDPSLFDTPVHRMRLLREINPKSVLAFNKKKRFNHYSKSLNFFERDKEHVTQAASLISEFLIKKPITHDAYSLHFPDAFFDDVRSFLSAFNNKKVIINVFTGSKERNFSQEQLAEIIAGLNEKYDNLNIILLDHRKEIDIPLPDNVVINPFNTLHHVMALIHECDLIISPDTAIVHISAAWKKNLIAVYKNVVDNNDLWAPGYDNASQIIVNNRAISQVKEVPELIAQEIKRRHLLD
ncbi:MULTISPECIES: glycosyltransferase family 9 protein [Erwinia]|uniref:glycosyltransferase family 9 protein n=1 Tax=Erwinia TaxID=551 RepID=UPI00133194BF|nr:glycosyltransferase family 9 protein [Erwinia rhapontici]MBP2154202.1 ADP-heptose:LPS heptosyltransferase [Erwinia rhapontici]MCS3606949.1 ADP-heptose:LPS heptosyltransferase [Erwinia rhapontici]BCQ38267.1 LOS biosynthesis enzyme LBGB [Erwinia rhapontici]